MTGFSVRLGIAEQRLRTAEARLATLETSLIALSQNIHSDMSRGRRGGVIYELCLSVRVLNSGVPVGAGVTVYWIEGGSTYPGDAWTFTSTDSDGIARIDDTDGLIWNVDEDSPRGPGGDIVTAAAYHIPYDGDWEYIDNEIPCNIEVLDLELAP